MTSFSSYTHGVHGAPPIGPQMTNYGTNRLEAERQKIRKIFDNSSNQTTYNMIHIFKAHKLLSLEYIYF